MRDRMKKSLQIAVALTLMTLLLVYVVDFGEVVRTHPDTRLIICGTGPLLDELKVIARTNGVEGHVTFAGLVDNQTIARFDAAA